MGTLRTIIVDEQPLFCRGIRHTLRQMGDCMLVGETTDAKEAVELARTSNPDVALIADGLSSTDALELVQQLRCLNPRLAMIILTPLEDEERLFQSIKAGAAAYYTRDITPEALREAVRKVSQGEFVITADVLMKPHPARKVLISSRKLAVQAEHTVHKDQHGPLTSREIEVLNYILRGKRNKEIAKALHISDQTVKNHISSILKKIPAKDRTAAVTHALQQGWIKMQNG